MKPDTGCEHARLQLMAAIDGEIDTASTADREHLSSCSSCEQWVDDLEAMDGRLRRLVYPAARVDLWASVSAGIRELAEKPDATGRLWFIGSLVLAWRVLQLVIDLPLPALHPLVPFAAATAALWQLAGDPLAVKTFAPELQKRGV
jgi:predicted anti-sigma-YlaC factor YlaD